MSCYSNLPASNKYPLADGQKVLTQSGETDKIMGEIAVPHTEPICWTLKGNWYRRSDGEAMTGAIYAGQEPVSVSVFLRWKRTRQA
jgi:hypothetical protein